MKVPRFAGLTGSPFGELGQQCGSLRNFIRKQNPIPTAEILWLELSKISCNGVISTPRLNPLRDLHLVPINLVVFQDPHNEV